MSLPLTNSLTPKFTSISPSIASSAPEMPNPMQSISLATYQSNMERIIQWILKLEEQLDKQDKIATHDLKIVKEQFQKHEV